ncbi:hypothetical protein [Paracidobacterium acidisoli]|uniref:Uncharacterized protein n=1 Tax=Paracidobacterium acidisoli TaxID=2303751 RepID=A0A372IRS3_9BACT|nr:hypothetical protein [Paracidobacterium acidisoli]MBT9330344.1 hypothetical protein [Paracidobacterium acidisoli]
MKSVLRALALTGVMGLAAAAAQAQVGIYVGASVPPAYAVQPPCPGVDFIWAPGYYVGTAWYPGRWMHREEYRRDDYGRAWAGHHDDHYDRGGYGHGYRGRR